MDLIERLISAAAADGIQVTFDDTFLQDINPLRAMNTNAYYVSYDTHDKYKKYNSEYIRFNPYGYKGDALRILIHELAHATGTTKRLNRMLFHTTLKMWSIMLDEGVFRARDIEELVAEGASHKVLYYLGYTDPSHGYWYMNHFLPKDLTDKEAVQIEKDIDAAANYIINNWLPQEQRRAA